MSSFETKWNELRASASGAEESARVQELVTLARQRGIRYRVAVVDARSGAPVPVASVGTDGAAKLRVDVTVEGGGEKTYSWEPRDAANVPFLFRE